MEKVSNNPRIYNAFKYVGMTSYDVIREFKRHLPKPYGKIGHFGTLDPFASGVLLIGVDGATRLNEYIHGDLSKTYLAVGKLGFHTDTGDNTVEPSKVDTSIYLNETIASFSKEFIEEKLKDKFIGKYMQAPHRYSAAKFEGKPLHQWAREGVNIQKDEVEREVYTIEVVKYSFPYLSIRFEVSSGTYIRTLFSDCAKYLGTHGMLVALLRESIGGISYKDGLKRKEWPKPDQSMEIDSIPMQVALPLMDLCLDEENSIRYKNGLPYTEVQYPEGEKFWVYGNNGDLLGLGLSDGEKVRTVFNLPTHPHQS